VEARPRRRRAAGRLAHRVRDEDHQLAPGGGRAAAALPGERQEAGGSEPSDLLRGVEQLEKQLGKENGEPRELSRREEAAPSPKRAALSERNPSASQAQMPARAAARAFEGRDQGALRRLGETLDGAALGDVLHGAPANVVGEAVGSLGTTQQVEVMRQCVQRLPADGEALLPILDALGARVFVGRDAERNAKLFRALVAAMVRVEAFTSNDDIKQANFVRSMLEAVASGRMPLFTMTTWAFFYGARPFDDEHWGKSSSTFSWSLEGGWYKEALRTLMYVGNERTLKMMHGPGFSGKVLAADVPKGVYRYSDLDEAQLRADWFWHFVPSVRSLHPRQALPPLAAGLMVTVCASLRRRWGQALAPAIEAIERAQEERGAERGETRRVIRRGGPPDMEAVRRAFQGA